MGLTKQERKSLCRKPSYPVRRLIARPHRKCCGRCCKNQTARSALPRATRPPGIFTRMVELKQALDLDCARVKCINMDEYVGVRREEPASCYFRIVRDLYAPLGLREDQFYVPVAPTSRRTGTGTLAHARGFGGSFMLLSVGGNGHIAFNEPGADFGRAHSCGESYAEHAAGQGRIVWRCRQGSGAGSYAGYC